MDMQKKGFIAMLVIVMGALCFIGLHGKNETVPSSADAKTIQLNEKIDIAGENTETAEKVQMQASADKVVFQPESLAIY